MYFFNNESILTAYSFLGISLIFLSIAILYADILLPLNLMWMKFGYTLGIIVSPVILGIIFFGFFTPTSILMKLFKRDELRLKLLKKNSYWRRRTNENKGNETFYNQF